MSDSITNPRMVEHWEQWKQARPKDGRPIKLAPILPIIFYHGEKPWNVPKRFSDLFDLPEALKDLVPDYQCWVYNISDYTDAEIKGSNILQMGLLALKHIYYDDLPQTLRTILGLWKQRDKTDDADTARDGLNFIKSLLRYILGGSFNSVYP